LRLTEARYVYRGPTYCSYYPTIHAEGEEFKVIILVDSVVSDYVKVFSVMLTHEFINTKNILLIHLPIGGLIIKCIGDHFNPRSKS
jgi:hypothetical protein